MNGAACVVSIELCGCPCRAVNPFQRLSNAAATAGITQSALQEANALLDLRMIPIPPVGTGGGGTPSAGSRFSPQQRPPTSSGSGGHLDPVPSPGAGDRASQQLPMRLLSGHNSGNPFSGVPHGFRVEAGGEAAALLHSGAAPANGNTADHHTVQTTSRGSTGGDTAPPPTSHTADASASVHARPDNHGWVCGVPPQRRRRQNAMP